MLVGGGLTVFVAAMLGSMLGDRLAWLCAGRGLPEFYQFAVAAMPPAAMGIALTLVHVDVKASAVITGGLFALLPGRALVAGVQDGLTGFYITAAARLLEVMYFFVSIVAGVLVVLYFGVQLGAELNPDAQLGTGDEPLVQIGASMLLSLAFAILLQQERSTVLAVTLNGGVAWSVYGAMHIAGDISPVASTAAAAGLVGLFGQLMSRYRFASALPYTTAPSGRCCPVRRRTSGCWRSRRARSTRGSCPCRRPWRSPWPSPSGVNLGGEISRLFLKVPGRRAPRGAGRRSGREGSSSGVRCPFGRRPPTGSGLRLRRRLRVRCGLCRPRGGAARRYSPAPLGGPQRPWW